MSFRSEYAVKPSAPGAAHVIWRSLQALKPSFHRHLAMLDRIPEEERGPEWEMAFILLCARHHKQGRRCHAKLAALKRQCRTPEERARFAAFIAELEQVLRPYGLSAHGYRVSFANREPENVVRQVKELLNLLNEKGYPAFINSGTLLGAVRSGTFIPHDDDIDIAVVLPVNRMSKVSGAFLDFAMMLRETGLLLEKEFGQARRPILKAETREGVKIDFFPAWAEKEGNFFIYPHTFGEVGRDEVLPLQPMALHGVELPAPRNFEALLTLNYGPNWRIPDPTFRFPWDEVQRRFSPLCKRYEQDRKQLSIRGAEDGPEALAAE